MVKIDPIIRATSLSDIAYERIRDSILSGRMEPGEIYNEKDIAQLMGVSRTPIREALRQLAAESLVTSIPGRGFKINRFYARDIEEIYEFRIALEVAIIKKIASDPESYDLARSEKLNRDLSSAIERSDYEEFVKIDRAFHSEISKLNGNARIEKALENSRDVSQLVADYKMMVSGRGKEIISEHLHILKCLKRGDVKEAKIGMESHLKKSLAAVLDILRGRESLISD